MESRENGEDLRGAGRLDTITGFCDTWLNPEGPETLNPEGHMLNFSGEISISKNAVEEWAKKSADRSEAWKKAQQKGLPPFPADFYLPSAYKHDFGSKEPPCDIHMAEPLTVDFAGMPQPEAGSLWSKMAENGFSGTELSVQNPEDSHLEGIEHIPLTRLTLKGWKGTEMALPFPGMAGHIAIDFVSCQNITTIPQWMIDWLNSAAVGDAATSKLNLNKCPVRKLPDGFLQATMPSRSRDRLSQTKLGIYYSTISDLPADFFEAKPISPEETPLVIRSPAYLPASYACSPPGENYMRLIVDMHPIPLRKLPLNLNCLDETDRRVSFGCWPPNTRYSLTEHPDLQW